MVDLKNGKESCKKFEKIFTSVVFSRARPPVSISPVLHFKRGFFRSENPALFGTSCCLFALAVSFSQLLI